MTLMHAQYPWPIAFLCQRSTTAVLTQLLLWFALGCFSPAALGTENRGQDAINVIAVELNRAESVTDGCRLSFVIQNRTPHAFASLQWDLVFFDQDNLIAGRATAEAAPLPQGKTRMKQYDVPGLACERLLRVLLNDVLRCDIVGGRNNPIDCLRVTEPSSRADIQFFK